MLLVSPAGETFTHTETFPKVSVLRCAIVKGVGLTEAGGGAGFSSFCSSAFLAGISGGWGTTLTTQLNILAVTHKRLLCVFVLFVRLKQFLISCFFEQNVDI